ncbi:lysine exporter protein LysE/YggA [Mycobacteroides abscessus subsp. abscessus]|nr:lysine exporter protein LysE/YggA [Mycobacteroides abscessus subsp. abscessus]
MGSMTAVGTMSGLVVWAIAAALGLSVLVQTSVLGYDILRIVGAGYLVWLGLNALGVFARHVPSATDDQSTGGILRQRYTRAYLDGLVSNLFNPKIGVFFLVFLPGFVPATEASRPGFALLLGAWFVVEAGAWLACVAWLVSRGTDWLHKPNRWIYHLERITGLVLISFGIRLAIECS